MVAVEKVVVHPLVLLTTVDYGSYHYRAAKKSMLQILLGRNTEGLLDVTSCFSVPFEIDEREPQIWFLDHSYLENMFNMLLKVNAQEEIVGWCRKATQLQMCDLAVRELMLDYCDNPVLVICDVEPKISGISVQSFITREFHVSSVIQKVEFGFSNMNTAVIASEAEEISIEHLLSGMNNARDDEVLNQITCKLQSFKCLIYRLKEVQAYLDLVARGKIRVNQKILCVLQDILYILSNMKSRQFVKAANKRMISTMMMMYLSIMIRSVLALRRFLTTDTISRK
jgi:26S proteasome regulatory subunit N8